MSQKTVKVYEWAGIGTLGLSLTIDGKRKEVNFPAGKEKPRTNAQFETSDEVIQGAIENNYLFHVGKIKVKRSYQITVADPVGTVKVEAPAAAAPATGGVKTEAAKKTAAPAKGVYPSIKTIQQAADKLVKDFKVPADQLGTPEAILAKAAELGVTFPNLPADSLI